MAKQPIDFWFSIGSMYTYLSVMRHRPRGGRNRQRFRWRPFSVRDIMIEMDNRPMSEADEARLYVARPASAAPARTACAFAGEPPYPLKNFDIANRIAVVGAEEGWCADYMRAAYPRWFVEHAGCRQGAEPRQPARNRPGPGARHRARGIGGDRRALCGSDRRGAQARHIRRADFRRRAAKMFWGDDRLEDAVAWSERQH